MTYQYYLTLEILSYLWIPLSLLVLAKFHWLLLLSLLWTFALFSLASKHWTQFLDPFSSLHTTSAWKLIWFCGFKYSTGLGISVFYVHFSPLSWIFRCLYPNCLLESLLGSQSCILNLHAQGWTLILPSNFQSSSADSLQTLMQPSPSQAKNIDNKSTLLFLTSGIQKPLRNLEGSICKIILRIQALFTISLAVFFFSFGPSTDISYL